MTTNSVHSFIGTASPSVCDTLAVVLYKKDIFLLEPIYKYAGVAPH